MGYEMRILVIDIMGETKEMQTSRKDHAFIFTLLLFLFFRFLSLHSRIRQSLFLPVRTK